ncbi:MAG: arsenosugar biosynthesis radical SAM protein ArsS [Paludibacter sp.]|nr:arsenosugar biosynthesis radical SAM protein ArsS [Paludibacter sp.]
MIAYNKAKEEAEALRQLQVLELVTTKSTNVPYFKDKLKEHNISSLKPVGLDVFQVNVGKMCNQTCRHCHVNAGPDRQEIMTKETMQLCLNAIQKFNIPIVDLTGGAPELNPHFRWFVKACHALGKRIIVRCNLTILLEADEHNDLPDFFAENGVEVVSSLPFYDATRTDKVRGKGVFETSIKALKMLNARGYGKPDSGLLLDLVYNPAGAFLPASQTMLETEFKEHLWSEHGIVFNKLFALTNLPVSRFLNYLVNTDNYVSYMEELVNAFNPLAAENVMCRNMISVSWDGYLFDCDFNQMLNMKVAADERNHVANFDLDYLLKREVKVSQHCYGCTAGAGSSCGGEIVLL